MTPAWLPWQLHGPLATKQPAPCPDLGDTSLLSEDSRKNKTKHCWKQSALPQRDHGKALKREESQCAWKVNAVNVAGSLDRTIAPQGPVRLRIDHNHSFELLVETVDCIFQHDTRAKAFCLAHQCTQDLVDSNLQSSTVVR